MKNNFYEKDGYIIIQYTTKKNEYFEIFVDKEDLEKLKNQCINIAKRGKAIYAVSTKIGKYLNQVIIPYNPKTHICIFKNGNKLDCRKNNIKIASREYNTYHTNGDTTIIKSINHKGDEYQILIDTEDIDKVNHKIWRVVRRHKCYYVLSDPDKNGDKDRKYIHQLLVPKDPKIENGTCDHINLNGLDNRKENLRYCTNQQNQWNKNLMATNKSGVTGVRLDTYRNRNKWVAEITINNKHVFLGQFDKFEDAISARRNAELYRGEFNPAKI